MTDSKKPNPRKPATKFANLRKQMERNKVRQHVAKTRVYKSGNR